MGKIFTRKQFSNYLGETRAILDVDTSFFQDITPIPITPTPTKTSTPTPTPTPTSTISVTPTPTPTPTQISNLFYVGAGFDTTADCVFVDSDGSIMVGGRFQFWQANPCEKLVRIDSQGYIDNAFTSGLDTASIVISNIAQSSVDDEVWIGGDFTTYGGLTTQRFTKIRKSTGSLVTGWDGLNAQNGITSILPDGDDVIIIGSFTSYKGTTRGRIARILNNNTVDTTKFTGAGFNNAPQKIIRNNAGNYVVVGGATTYNGGTINRIVEIDATTGNNTGLFGTGFGSTTVNDVAYDPTTGYYYVVGNTNSSYQGGPASWIHVIDNSGTLVTSTPPVASTTNCFNIVGDFANDALYCAFGTPVPFRKINVSSYTADSTWLSNVGVVNNTTSANSRIFAQTDSNGKTYIVGLFTKFNNQNYNRIIRLNSNGTTNSYI